MAVLSESIQNRIRETFANLPRPVTVVVFSHASDESCESCDQTRVLIDELAAASAGRVRVEAVAVDMQPEEVARYKIDKLPAVVVLGGESGREDLGIRFFGAPSGYEFATLIEDIRMASTRTTDLSTATIDALSHLEMPLHIQVFVTPSCPYCPRAVLLAHKMAITSGWITADAVDATEFPDLADRYKVRGVPHTVINDEVQVEGAVPEPILIAQLIPLLESDASLGA